MKIVKFALAHFLLLALLVVAVGIVSKSSAFAAIMLAVYGWTYFMTMISDMFDPDFVLEVDRTVKWQTVVDQVSRWSSWLVISHLCAVMIAQLLGDDLASRTLGIVTGWGLVAYMVNVIVNATNPRDVLPKSTLVLNENTQPDPDQHVVSEYLRA